MNQNYPRQPSLSGGGGDQSAFYYAGGFPIPVIESPELLQQQIQRPQLIPNVPGWSAEEIQYLLTLREVPGYENHFGIEREHTIPEMAKRLTEAFSHKPHYNPSSLSRMWNLYIVPPGPQKDPRFNEYPPTLFTSGVPKTGFGVQSGRSQQVTTPLNPFDAHSSHRSFYEGSRTYYGQQRGQTTSSPDVNYYGPSQSTHHISSWDLPRSDQQYGVRSLSQGASYQFSPNSNLQYPAIAPYSPRLSQPSYKQGAGFTMIPGMEQGLTPQEFDYNDITIQPPIRDHGVVAGPGNLGQRNQLIQPQGYGRPTRSANLMNGECDQDWHDGCENFGDLSEGLDVPTAEEVECDLRNIFHYRGP